VSQHYRFQKRIPQAPHCIRDAKQNAQKKRKLCKDWRKKLEKNPVDKSYQQRVDLVAVNKVKRKLAKQQLVFDAKKHNPTRVSGVIWLCNKKQQDQWHVRENANNEFL
jgi:hypothetical protein